MSIFDDFAAELERREDKLLREAGWERVTTICPPNMWRRLSDGKAFPRAEALEQARAQQRKRVSGG